MKQNAMTVQHANADPTRIDINNIGTGTLYSVGTIIGLFLQTESEWQRISILADVIDTLQIDHTELIDRLNSSVCPHCICRTSALHPCECEAADRSTLHTAPTPAAT